MGPTEPLASGDGCPSRWLVTARAQAASSWASARRTFADHATGTDWSRKEPVPPDAADGSDISGSAGELPPAGCWGPGEQVVAPPWVHSSGAQDTWAPRPELGRSTALGSEPHIFARNRSQRENERRTGFEPATPSLGSSCS